MRVYQELIQKYKSNRKREFDKRVPIDRFFFRPVSLLVSPVFIILGFSPNAVTLSSALVGLVAVLMFCSGHGFLWASLCALAAKVLDYVDGNVARFRGQTSFYGKFLDGLVDSLLSALLVIGMGIGLYRSDTVIPSLPWWNHTLYLIMISLMVTMELFAQVAMFRLRCFAQEAQAQRGDHPNEGPMSPSVSALARMAKGYLGIGRNFFYVLLILCVVLNGLHWFFLGLFVYSIGCFVLRIGGTMRLARTQLDVFREY